MTLQELLIVVIWGLDQKTGVLRRDTFNLILLDVKNQNSFSE